MESGLPNAKSKGFSLIEIAIAVLVMALLLVFSVSVYERQILVTRRALAGTELLNIMAEQEHFFLQNRHYAALLTELGHGANLYAVDAGGAEVSADSNDRVYVIGMLAEAGGFRLHATPQRGQVRDNFCGTLSLYSNGIKTIAGTGSVAQCW